MELGDAVLGDAPMLVAAETAEPVKEKRYGREEVRLCRWT